MKTWSGRNVNNQVKNDSTKNKILKRLQQNNTYESQKWKSSMYNQNNGTSLNLYLVFLPLPKKNSSRKSMKTMNLIHNQIIVEV